MGHFSGQNRQISLAIMGCIIVSPVIISSRMSRNCQCRTSPQISYHKLWPRAQLITENLHISLLIFTFLHEILVASVLVHYWEVSIWNLTYHSGFMTKSPFFSVQCPVHFYNNNNIHPNLEIYGLWTLLLHMGILRLNSLSVVTHKFWGFWGCPGKRGTPTTPPPKLALNYDKPINFSRHEGVQSSRLLYWETLSKFFWSLIVCMFTEHVTFIM